MGKHKVGVSRTQTALLPAAVEDYVGADSVVRVIDAYVDELDLKGLGFVRSVPADRGRPGYAPGDLLKLYLYGYWNRVRSSRRLETECRRNLEVLWLLRRLAPDHKSIAEFRRVNAAVFQKVCARFVQWLRQAGLVGAGEAPVVAVDGSHFKANAAKASLMNAEQLAKAQKKTEARIAEYLAQLDEADREEAGEVMPNAEQVRGALRKLREREDTLAQAATQLAKKAAQADKDSTPRVGLTDPDSVLLTKRGVTVVGYTVQQAVEAEHKFIIAHEVNTAHNDHAILRILPGQAQAALGDKPLTLTADTGCQNGALSEACEARGITPVMRMAQVAQTKGENLHPKSAFSYDAQTDTWRCPANQWLRRYKRDASKQTDYYSSSACLACAQKDQCTEAAQRTITRSWHAAALERADARARAQPRLMRLRSATVEHPFGNLKAMMAGGFLVRTLAKVKGEMALAVLTYNLKHALNLLGMQGLMTMFNTNAELSGA